MAARHSKRKRSPEASLARYRSKRDFSITPEPAGGGTSRANDRRFVVQKHWATRLHYDLRLELDGTMKSWAVPKGPSFDTKVRRMAVQVEDHPISYNDFEGEIPGKQYGAGKVIIWDKGSWTPLDDPERGYRDGTLKFTLQGHKLQGAWALVRIKSRQSTQETWLLIKERDAFVRSETEFSVTEEKPNSVAQLPRPTVIANVHAPEQPHRNTGKRTPGKTLTPGGAPPGAVKATVPSHFAPELATLVDRPPSSPDDWLYEVKFDGYRLLTKIGPKTVRLITRNGHDWTDRLPHLKAGLESMSLKSGWLDGEIVMLSENGSSSFQRLQNAFDSTRTGDIVYFVFDLPFYAGYDLTGVKLRDRRALLQPLLQDAPDFIRFSEAFEASPTDLVASACKLGLEGIIGKRRDSHYRSSRSPDWIKLKCGHRQEFVIGGWTDPKGSRTGLGSLLLGVHDSDGRLVYAGKVGSGFNAGSLAKVSAALKRRAGTQSPFKGRIAESGVHWVKPALIAEVSFSEWTSGGHLRHPVFQALRADKAAKAIVREDPVTPLGPDREEPTPLIPSRVRVSNPDRVVDPASGVTKIQILRYYALVGELMMEHIAGRPVSLVKAPQGIGKPTFFQKHLENQVMDGIKSLNRNIDPGHPAYMEILSPLGLLSAAQMNVIEIHSWNATKPMFRKPDQMVFDLDPGQGVDWKSVQQGAELMHHFLQELRLPAFLKASGGKGLHVVTPLKHEFDWDTVKAFSQAIVTHMASTLPQLFVSKSGPKNRIGKIFIDYLRNGFGATTASAWSVRARPGLGISVPVAWTELNKLESAAQWSVITAQERIAEGNKPWAEFRRSAASLKFAMASLQFNIRGGRQPRRRN